MKDIYVALTKNYRAIKATYKMGRNIWRVDEDRKASDAIWFCKNIDTGVIAAPLSPSNGRARECNLCSYTE